MADEFRQDGSFFYFTGLANTSGALLAIDGRSGDSWLFLEPDPPLRRAGFTPEVLPDAGAASRFTTKNAAARIDSLMAIQSADEQRALRSAATATVAALKAGTRAIRPGVHQRAVEAAVENACWTAGAHGSTFWPWAMAGANAMMPRPFVSGGLYDHLDTVMQPGELVRLDVGCEWDHYGGDLGRTVPVSGHYTDEQREDMYLITPTGAELLTPGVPYTATDLEGAMR